MKELGRWTLRMEVVSRPYIGPSPYGRHYPRPTDGAQLGETFFPLSWSHRYPLYHCSCLLYFLNSFVFVNSSCSLVGSTAIIYSGYEWVM